MTIKKIRNFQIFSTIFTFIVGTLLHFTFELSGLNPKFAIFSAINESTWEHLKLLYFPMLLSTIFGIILFKNRIPNFLCSKTIGILTSIIFEIIFFYTYTGILGNNITIIDISLFFVSTILGEFVAYILIVNKFKCNNKLALLILFFIFMLFIIFTFNPPKIGLFKDPITKIYGIHTLIEK